MVSPQCEEELATLFAILGPDSVRVDRQVVPSARGEVVPTKSSPQQSVLATAEGPDKDNDDDDNNDDGDAATAATGVVVRCVVRAHPGGAEANRVELVLAVTLPPAYLWCPHDVREAVVAVQHEDDDEDDDDDDEDGDGHFGGVASGGLGGDFALDAALRPTWTQVAALHALLLGGAGDGSGTIVDSAAASAAAVATTTGGGAAALMQAGFVDPGRVALSWRSSSSPSFSATLPLAAAADTSSIPTRRKEGIEEQHDHGDGKGYHDGVDGDGGGADDQTLLLSPDELAAVGLNQLALSFLHNRCVSPVLAACRAEVEATLDRDSGSFAPLPVLFDLCERLREELDTINDAAADGLLAMLPPDVLRHVCGFLAPADLARLAKANRFLRGVAGANTAWQHHARDAVRWRAGMRRAADDILRVAPGGSSRSAVVNSAVTTSGDIDSPLPASAAAAAAAAAASRAAQAMRKAAAELARGGAPEVDPAGTLYRDMYRLLVAPDPQRQMFAVSVVARVGTGDAWEREALVPWPRSLKTELRDLYGIYMVDGELLFPRPALGGGDGGDTGRRGEEAAPGSSLREKLVLTSAGSWIPATAVGRYRLLEPEPACSLFGPQLVYPEHAPREFRAAAGGGGAPARSTPKGNITTQQQQRSAGEERLCAYVGHTLGVVQFFVYADCWAAESLSPYTHRALCAVGRGSIADVSAWRPRPTLPSRADGMHNSSSSGGDGGDLAAGGAGMPDFRATPCLAEEEIVVGSGRSLPTAEAEIMSRMLVDVRTGGGGTRYVADLLARVNRAVFKVHRRLNGGGSDGGGAREVQLVRHDPGSRFPLAVSDAMDRALQDALVAQAEGARVWVVRAFSESRAGQIRYDPHWDATTVYLWRLREAIRRRGARADGVRTSLSAVRGALGVLGSGPLDAGGAAPPPLSHLQLVAACVLACFPTVRLVAAVAADDSSATTTTTSGLSAAAAAATAAASGSNNNDGEAAVMYYFDGFRLASSSSWSSAGRHHQGPGRR